MQGRTSFPGRIDVSLLLPYYVWRSFLAGLPIHVVAPQCSRNPLNTQLANHMPSAAYSLPFPSLYCCCPAACWSPLPDSSVSICSSRSSGWLNIQSTALSALLSWGCRNERNNIRKRSSVRGSRLEMNAAGPKKKGRCASPGWWWPNPKKCLTKSASISVWPCSHVDRSWDTRASLPWLSAL